MLAGVSSSLLVPAFADLSFVEVAGYSWGFAEIGLLELPRLLGLEADLSVG